MALSSLAAQTSLFLRSNPGLRKALSPALAVRRKLFRQKQEARDDMVARLRDVMVGDVPLRVPEYNGVFEVDPRSSLFYRLVVLRDFEFDLVKLATAALKPGYDAIDVGANVGFYSVAMAKNMGSGRVLAVEPQSSTAERLRRNLARNGVEDAVTVFQGAVSDKPGTLSLQTIEGNEEYSSLGQIVHHHMAQAKVRSETVEVRTVDALVAEHALKPAIIKIDVEGFERGVLQGAVETIRAHKPVILSELDDPLLRSNGFSADDVIRFIRQFGYDIKDANDPTSPPGKRRASDIICSPV